MVIVLVLFAAGIVIGYLVKHNEKLVKTNDHLTNIAIYLLLFLLGINVGSNDQIIRNFEVIGLNSLLVSIFAVAGSIFCAWIIQNLIFRKGNEK